MQVVATAVKLGRPGLDLRRVVDVGPHLEYLCHSFRRQGGFEHELHIRWMAWGVAPSGLVDVLWLLRVLQGGQLYLLKRQ